MERGGARRVVLASVLAGCLLMGTTTSAASTTLAEKLKNNDGKKFNYTVEQPVTYREQLEEYRQKGYKDAVHDVLPVSFTPIVEGRAGQMISGSEMGWDGEIFSWSNGETDATWRFEVPEAGLYELEFTYALSELGDEAVRTLLIDGSQSFREMSKLVFQGGWKNETDEPQYNGLGDQIRPKQVYIPDWRTICVEDSLGFYTLPLKFYFSAGKHDVRLEYIASALYIADIRLKAPVSLPTYAQKKQEYAELGYRDVSKNAKLYFQAEDNLNSKSHASIRMDADSSATVQPNSLKYVRMNIIGGYTWKTGNQRISWSFTVKESGLYTIGLRLRQQGNEGLPSYRQIAIDGAVPFEELLAYPFPFDRYWQTHTLQDAQKEPYRFYLEAGNHTLTMTVKLGELTDIVSELYKDSLSLSNLLTRIMMLTGDTPDANFNYELEIRIPELLPTLQSLADSIKTAADRVVAVSGQKNAFSSAMESNADSIRKLLSKPDRIAVNLSELETVQSALTDWYAVLQEQPLALDVIYIGSASEAFPDPRPNFFETILRFFQNLCYSFMRDYDAVDSGAKDGEAAISVWVGRSKEWAEVLKRLVDDDFTPQSGIAVEMNIVPASQLGSGTVNALMLSIISGTSPDVVLATSVGSPVELAIRNAVVDLSDLDGYDTFSKNFLPGILTPFQYGEGIYGLPETMDFSVMFYRKDILKELDLDLPQTWEDVFSHTLPVLYQNNMEMFIPTDFTPFLYQFGGEYYVEDGRYTGLDTDEALKAFKYYCEIFTHYDVPVAANFYNRFRTGIMPIGISGFPMYLQLQVAAPELTGKWGIAMTPGTRRDDGEIDRSYAGLSTDADMILKKNSSVENSWRFLSWWLNENTQVQYARDLEVTIGASAKWNPSNVNAYPRLYWDTGDLKIIQAMQSWGRDVPNVLGGYFTGRHLNNAWNRTVLGGMSARDSLEMAVIDINKELLAKQKEYGKTFD